MVILEIHRIVKNKFQRLIVSNVMLSRQMKSRKH